QIRDGYERQQWLDLLSTLGSITPSSAAHRWVFDLNGDGEFPVKDIRSSLDDLFLLSMAAAIRWVKYIPVKVNVFVWRARLVRLPTRGYVVGGISIGLMFLRLKIGMFGSALSGCP
nr:RNA-directed DNA polymerase, eukaryota [Tanacetum cinerariifolium]